MKPLEGKTGICFSGRDHHAKKLAELMSYMEEHGGLQIRFVTSAFNSYNVDSFERPLIDQGLSYDLIQDWMNQELVSEMHQHNRAVQDEITSRMFNKDNNILDDISTIWTRDAFRDTIECYVLFREYLKDVQPDVVFVLHEANFWTKILAYWAHEMGIPIVSFQEGLYRPPGGNKYFSYFYQHALVDYSTRVCLWGNYTKDIFLNCGHTADKFAVVGAPHLDKLLAKPAGERMNIREQTRGDLNIKQDQKVILLLLTPARIWSGDLQRDVQMVGEWVLHQQDVFLIVKWHPLEHDKLVEQVKAQIGETIEKLHLESFVPTTEIANRIIHEHGRDITSLIWSSDLALIQDSTSGLECMVFGLPLIEVKFDSKPLKNSYFSDGVAERIHNPQDLSKLSDFLNGEKQHVTSEKVQRYLEHSMHRLDGRTRDRILDVVTELIG